MFGFFAQTIAVGAHAVGLVTHATPAISNESLTEAYLTQPAIMADVGFGPFQFTGMFNFEGLTLRRGELNAGVWGEGYSDRRHPHTYLHEAVLTLQTTLAGTELSISAGRGFVPFGTDDPMVRPFVKYPANHHLSQILERLVALGAVRFGPAIAEASVFAGAEPVDPEDLGDVEKFGDSWSARLTLLPVPWLELQGSYAAVTSPENVFGEGLDHTMWNASARVERAWRGHLMYALLEAGQTDEGSGQLAFHYPTLLAETAVGRGAWQLGVRFERTVRPEEERQLDLFRTIRPHTDASILGTTRFTSGTLMAARSVAFGALILQPFFEVSRLHAEALDEFPVLPPEGLYGSNHLWSFSVGIRSVIGTWHTRMGRYGAARPSARHHQH